jgi:NAD+ diphosphatase
MKTSFLSQLHPPIPVNQPALWFIFKNEQILLADNHTIPRLFTPPLPIQHPHYLGTYNATPCYAAEVLEAAHSPSAMSFQPLRYELADNNDLFLIAARAKQILHWDKATQFCGRCGSSTQHSEQERAKICLHCNILTYPQIAPVALALVWRKKEILLARSPHFPAGVYSLLAGFVEPGETIEQAVAREVKEEVSIDIKNLQYAGSQPWPFPSNLMIGFTAEYDSGEIIMDPVEIEDAQWFALTKLPTLPNPLSLSRHIIEKFLSLQAN